MSQLIVNDTSQFRMKKENFRFAVEAVEKFLRLDRWGLGIPKYVQNGRPGLIEEARQVAWMFESMSFLPEFDDDCNLIFLVLDSGYLQDTAAVFLQRIAKYVDAGSFMTFSDGDGSHWRYLFTGDVMLTQKGTITYA